MVNWKVFKITSVYESLYENRITFYLKGCIMYSNDFGNYISCINESPFNNYRVGDEIEVDLDGAKRIIRESIVSDNSIMRRISSPSSYSSSSTNIIIDSNAQINGNWWCNNCNSWEDSWAEQIHGLKEIFRQDIRCWKCDKLTLVYPNSQKERYKELVKERTSIPGTIKEVERFNTWWNNNIATVITYYNDYYRTFLLVYDPVYSTYQPAVFPVDKDCDYWGKGRGRGKWTYLSGARGEAKWLREELKDTYKEYGKNPILLIHPYANEYKPFSWVVDSPYVVKNQVGSSTKTIDVPLFFVGYNSSTPADLDKHFRPLDIVQVKCVDNWLGKRFYHVGFYLGNDSVFHFSRENNAVEKTSWSGFLRDSTKKIIRYHPIIPFKRYLEVVRQAVWAKDNNFRKGNYNLPNRNCEHFSNMCIYGINFSQQVREREGELTVKASVQSVGIGAAGGFIAGTSMFLAPFSGGLSLIPGAIGTTASIAAIADNAESNGTLNNGKTSICLSNEIRETNNLLGQKSDWETEKYVKQYLQEIPPKEYCRIV